MNWIKRDKSAQLLLRTLGSVVFISIILLFDSGCADKNESKQNLWTCSMHPQVIQDHPGHCPICHMTLVPLKESASDEMNDGSHNALDTSKVPEKKVKYWWDPMMSPPYISKTPGKSPMGMDLIPVYEDNNQSNGKSLSIDPAIVQNMGIRTAIVSMRSLSQEIGAVGYLAEAERNVHSLNLLVTGWVRKLYVSTEGMNVEKRQPLFDLYSPELNVAVQELISATKNYGQVGSSQKSILNAAKKKLELWGLTKEQISNLENEAVVPSVVTFLSPATGVITQKNIVEGSGVKVGDELLKIVDLKTLWLNAQVFEKDLPQISIGQRAVATIGDKTLEASVVFIDPRVESETRTAKVRLQIPNSDLSLKPGMFATISIKFQTSGAILTVPREAVIDTGKRKITFIALADGKFDLREVETGISGELGLIEVTSGLKVGEKVVTSGQFLLDSESRLREAVQKFISEKKQLVGNITDSKKAITSSSHISHGEPLRD